jgi:DNA-binding winged helix-turn-helix (wHTH) protein
VTQEVNQAGSFRIGDWLVEPSLSRVSRGDISAQLEIKMMEVLVCLASRAGELVTREELVDTVWATEFISDNTLTHAIAELRRALDDDARHPEFIETIHRRGYRLIAPVAGLESDGVPPSPRQEADRFKIVSAEGEVLLSEGETLIGREPDAAVSIDSSKVSRHHARILIDGVTATLEDLGSKNGTFLNGERIEAHADLSDGDEIRIGRHIARYRFVVMGDRTMTEHSLQQAGEDLVPEQ